MTSIAFQGQPGAYSDLISRLSYPDMTTLPCETFQAAIEAVHEGRAALAMLPPENSLAGRVADMHALLPQSGLSIIGEKFLRVEHCLLAPPGATLSSIKRIHSHPVALGQVRNLIRELGATAVVEYDTAGAAEIIAAKNSIEDAAIASSLAGELHGLQILRRNVAGVPEAGAPRRMGAPALLTHRAPVTGGGVPVSTRATRMGAPALLTHRAPVTGGGVPGYPAELPHGWVRPHS